MPTKRSLAPPKFTIKHRAANRPHYDQSLIERDKITLWLSHNEVATWNANPTHSTQLRPALTHLVMLGRSPVSAPRNATMESTCWLLSSRDSWISAMLRTASSSSTMLPSW